MFLLGLGLAAAGGYLLLNQVQVHGGYWRVSGMSNGSAFGLTLIPLLLGIGLLFFDGKSKPGWLLTGIGGVVLLAGILANLDIHFRQTSLYNTLTMLVLLVAGLGLMFRSMRAVGAGDPDDDGRGGKGRGAAPTSEKR